MRKIIFLILLFLFNSKIVFAQSANYLETKVVDIPVQENRQVLGNQVTYQKLKLLITKGSQSGRAIRIS